MLVTDIGGSHITSCLYDEDLQTLDNNHAVRHPYNAYATKKEIIDVWNVHFKHFSSIQKCAVALPGPFDYYNGIGQYLAGEKLGSLANFSVIEYLQKMYGPSTQVACLNDAESFGRGVFTNYPVIKNYNSLALTLGTGLGDCLIQSNLNSLRSFSVLKLYQQTFKQTTTEDYFSTRWFCEYIHTINQKKYSGLKEIMQSESELVIQKMFGTFAKNFGNFTSEIAKKYDLRYLIIGGNIAKAHKYFKTALEKILPSNVSIIIVSDTEQTILLGAASIFK